MTDRSNRDARDLGSDSPASKEAAEQTKSGTEGAPRGHGEAGGTDRQPSQASNRSGRGPEPRARKHFDEEQQPSEQGEGDASPDHVRDSSHRMHGMKRQSGSRADTTARGEDEATVHEK